MSATVQVRTLPRTMSGQRGNLILTLDRETAKDWIAKKWAAPVEDKAPKRRESKDDADGA